MQNKKCVSSDVTNNKYASKNRYALVVTSLITHMYFRDVTNNEYLLNVYAAKFLISLIACIKS